MLFNWQKVAAGKADDGLVGRFVPLDGGFGFGSEILACEYGMEDTDSIEIVVILVGAEMLKKLGEFFARGKGP